MTEFLTRIAGLCLCRMVLDMALPESEGRQYADLGVGLLMMLQMLRGLRALFRGGP